jgi:outer membrane protein assembly factor BamA
MLGGLALIGSAWGQTAAPPDSPAPPARWTLVSDGRETPWPLAGPLPLDSLDAAAARALDALRRAGYYYATLDSARIDEEAQPPEVRLYVTKGPKVVVGRIRLLGVTALDSLALLEAMDTRPGRPLDPERLEADLESILLRYEASGYPLAQIRIEDAGLLPGDPPRLALTIRVEEGGALVIDRVELIGAERTKAAYVARLAGLRLGVPAPSYDPDEIRRRLEESEFFEEVGLPELVLEKDGTTALRIRVKEASPGSFDLVLGYLPPAGGSGSGSIVGNGHILLHNLFGGGRVISLRLNRLPGQVSSVDASFSDPFLLGLPVGGKGRFEGLQQDSTYGKQRYQAEFSYRLTGEFQAFVTVTRETTNPGKAGLQLGGGTQRIPRASAFFAGLGVRYRRLDQSVNPRRGFVVETNFERGRKERTASVLTAEGDTTREGSALRQQRLRARFRLFLPALRRQVLALGGEAGVLLSNTYDESDLFRLGGASSLRGYDEDRFRGRFTARAFVEYRYRIERLSYAYLFFDLGYVDTPEAAGLTAARRFYPGYGLGIQFRAPIGLINTSYAVNSEDGPTNGRVHVGLSFGL